MRKSHAIEYSGLNSGGSEITASDRVFRLGKTSKGGISSKQTGKEHMDTNRSVTKLGIVEPNLGT